MHLQRTNIRVSYNGEIPAPLTVFSVAFRRWYWAGFVYQLTPNADSLENKKMLTYSLHEIYLDIIFV